MGNSFYGKLDYTNLCRLWRDHKELFEMVDFKDGQHALLKVNFNERKEADEHGNTHYLQASCKAADRKEGLNYYISSGFKPSQQQTQATAEQSPAQDVGNNDLPF